MTTEEILNALEHPEFGGCDEAVAEAIRRREEFVPLLIAAVEKAVRSPKSGRSGDLPIVALYLLAQMQEASALEAVLAVFELDYLLQEDAFGFVVSDYGARLLACVASRDPGLLEECVQRKSLGEVTRWGALQALVLQAAWRWRPVEAVVQFFHQLFETEAFVDAPEAWTYLVDSCLDLDASLFLEEIRKLYERGLVDEEVVGNFKSVEKEAAEDREIRFARMRIYSWPITNTAEEWRGIFGSEGESDDDDEGEGKEGSVFRPICETPAPFQAAPESRSATPFLAEYKIGRNELCPCGRGKKYKKCCLRPGR